MNADLAAPAGVSQRLVPVLENVAIARETDRLRLDDPILARAILPGQFLMIRPAAEGADDPLLGRPFALYDVTTDVAGAPTSVDVVYLVVGRGTAALAQRRPGEQLSVWGPLGNGFGPPPAGPVIFVAGGIGQTPFLAQGRWWLGKMSYGLQSKGLDPPCPGSASGSPHRPRRPCSMACAPPRCWRGSMISARWESTSRLRLTTVRPGTEGS